MLTKTNQDGNIVLQQVGKTPVNAVTEDSIQKDLSEQGTDNFIINGGFDFWQRGTSFVSVVTNTYQADRFSYSKSGAMVHDITKSTDVPSASGFKSLNSMKLDCTTADSSMDATDYTSIRYTFEGLDFQRFVGIPITISFWVKATKTGIYSLAVRNLLSSRSIVYEFTINSSLVWEKKSITLTIENGSYSFTNDAAIGIWFTLMSGSNYQTSPGSWVAGTKLASTNQVNGCDSASNDFYLAQVMLNIGTKAAPFKRAGVTIGGELQLCCRYTWSPSVSTEDLLFPQAQQDANNIYFPIVFPVQMRANPFFQGPSPFTTGFNIRTFAGANAAGFTMSLSGSSPLGAYISGTKMAHGLTGGTSFGPISGIYFSAEF